MKFQNKMGMKPDGIVGPGTWKAMQLPWSKETNEPHREDHQYLIILNNKNIHNDVKKAGDNKTPSNGEVDYLANIKSNLYILGYKNVYTDYKAARNQFLKDYFDNGHSLHADFIRMGEGEHNSTVLEWTNKALAHKITRNAKNAQGLENKRDINYFIDGFIEHFTDKVDAAKKYYSELFTNPIEKVIEVYTDPRTYAGINPGIDTLVQLYDLGIIAYGDYKILTSGDKQAMLKRAGDATGQLCEVIVLSVVLRKFGNIKGTKKNGSLNGVKGGIKTLSEIAKSRQGSGKYPGIDNYKDITLRKGTVIYRGEPNGTEFFTTKSAIERSGRDATAIFEGLQVEKNQIHGYRRNMQGYMVNEDVKAAFGITKANPQFGKGGLPQIFVPNVQELINKRILVPFDNIPLVNRGD